MSGRHRLTWFWFAVSAGLVLCALGWTTAETLRLERQEFEALRRAGLEASFRNALGRMQSVLGPVFAPEEARPYFHYRAYYTPPRAFEVRESRAAKERQEVPAGRVELVSPLAISTPRFIRIHFEISETGVNSPQVPAARDGNEEGASGRDDAARSRAVPPIGKEGAAAWLGRLREIASALEIGPLDRGNDLDVVLSQSNVVPDQNNYESVSQWRKPQVQQLLSNNEFLARDNIQNSVRLYLNAVGNDLHRASPETAVEQSPLRPMWLELGDAWELFFMRTVTAEGQTRVQGIWVDWPALESWLLAEIDDIFPEGRLVPALSPAQGADGRPTDEAGRRLSSIPLILEADRSEREAMSPGTATRGGLVVIWIAVIGALLSVAFVLRASLDLGERRGRFVTAVTHELRTPLTTFQMYAQMLADGMIKGDEARQEYLETLKDESGRLARVVESVLLYSRLEQGGAASRRESISVTELLDRALVPLTRRAATGEMELVVETVVAAGAMVEVDPQAIEQVLLNLADNACKYASEAEDRRLHLDVRTREHLLEIVFRDHGPGVPNDVRAGLFDAFRRARRHESGPVTGVGLGLALARGLARAFGGDVTLLDSGGDGASFKVTLPLA